MRFYDCISKYLSATKDTHYIKGLEWNYSQMIVGAAEGRSTGTNYDKHSYTDAWRTAVLSDQQKIILPPYLIFYRWRKRSYITDDDKSPAGLL